MFKKYRKLTAVVLSLALVFTGIAFTPKATEAATKSVTAEAGGSAVEGTDGYWTYTVIPGANEQYTWPVTATFGDYNSVDGFEASLSAYSYDGSYWKADLKSAYNLVAGQGYQCTINITQTPASGDYTAINVRTTKGSVNISPQTKTASAGQTTLQWTGRVVPTNGGLELDISYGNDGDGGKLGGYAGSFEVTSVVLTPEATSTVTTTTADPTVPQNVSVYNYYANSKGYQVNFSPVEGASEYKVYMDNSAALATVTESGTFLNASTFSTYADDALHNVYVSAVISGTEHDKSKPASVRVMSKTSDSGDPTDIPRVYIVTNKGDNSSITKESKTPCSLIVKGGQDGVKSALGDGSIKLRGNSTKFADKKAYNISFNSKVALMDGRNKGKKWCLLAAAYDKSILRTKVGMHLGQIFNNVAAPEDHFVEVYLNGTLMGLYDMCEPADNGRSGISYDDSAESEEMMFELENGKSDGVNYDRDEIQDGVMYHNAAVTNSRFVCEDMEDEVLALVDDYKNNQGITYDYNTYMDLLDEDLSSNPKYAAWVDILDKADKQIRNYATDKVYNYIDLDSFVDMYIINEIMSTVDFNYSSVKFYVKKVNGQPKVFAGCIWDFDLSTGNSYYDIGRTYNDFKAMGNPWFKYLMRNTKFQNAVKARFSEKLRAVKNLFYGDQSQGYGTCYIDQMASYMEEARKRNYKSKAQGGAGWDEGTPDSYDVYQAGHEWAYSYSCVTESLTENVIANQGTVFANYTYADHVQYLKDFLEEHFTVMCNEWQPTEPAVQESDELDITGYQMSATVNGQIDNIGFRNVFQFEPTIMGETITERGLVFGLKTIDQTPTGITADDVYVGNSSEYVQSYAAGAAAKVDYQYGDSKTADYYAMTMTNETTVDHALYRSQFIVRAYVQTAGGGYIYSKPYEYTYYNVADYLYQHNLFSNEITHNSIYNNVLNYSGHPYTEIDFNWGNAVVKP